MKIVPLMVGLMAVVLAAVIGCGSEEPSGGKGYCKAICTKSRALKCANDDLTGCEDACDKHGGVAACTGQFDALVACASKDTLVCNSDGESAPTGCQNEISAYTNCVIKQ